MKPLNLDNRPCSPISSNCVIWQGPDIPCIKLCTGDTISDVVFKLATELCTIMDQLKVSNYDLTCLNLNACPPDDFQALIQLLIDKVCELNGIPTGIDKSAGCPDCVVSVAPCFVQGTTTTMQLVDYVQMIANKICSIISDIDGIKDDIITINTTLIDIQNQIDELPTYTLPSIPVNCILPTGSYPLDQALNALFNDSAKGYCSLLGSTGTPSEITTAVLTQCITDLDQPLAALPAVNTFSTYYLGSWVNSATLGSFPTVANSIKNIWIAICDIYNYVKDLPKTVVAAGSGVTVTSSTVSNTTTYTVSATGSVPTTDDTNTINLINTSGVITASIQDTGWVDLLGFNYLSSNSSRPQCRRIGNEIHFRGVIQIPMGNANEGAAGNVVPASSPDAYRNNAEGWVYDAGQTTTGSPTSDDPNENACVIYSAGPTSPGIASTSAAYNKHEGTIIRFRRGQNVIPTSVIPSPTTYLDGTYTLGNRQFIARGIQIGNAPGVVTGFDITLAGSGYSTGLYTVYGGSGTGFIVNITAVNFSGGITSAVIKEGGASYTVGDVLYVYNGNTPLARLTVTSITTGIKDLYLQTHIGVFIDSSGTLNVSAPNSIENFNGEGLKYGGILRNVVHNTIQGNFIPTFAHESFSVNNAAGEIGSDRTYGPELKASKATWPFSVNCNNAAELGGFSFRLDGLRTFIKPCSSSPTPLPIIPTPTPVCS